MKRTGIVSLFCGAGGFDLGFERAGFEVDIALDLRKDSIESYNYNRDKMTGHVADVCRTTVDTLDGLAGRKLRPIGLIGGPPCQSFSRATVSADDDPRHVLPLQFSRLLRAFNKRAPVSFFAFENVPGLLKSKHEKRFQRILRSFERSGFTLSQAVLNASSFAVPQNRPRLIIVGINKELYPDTSWVQPKPTSDVLATVRDAIGGLSAPKRWSRGLIESDMPVHPNHWCMVPKSAKFSTRGALVSGTSWGRSFRMLSWNAPSHTVAYGNREVHIHPSGKRRLSVFEALLLQGFPKDYVLKGTLSSQITQVSEAVSPPLAFAVAESIREQLFTDRVRRRKAA